jgi:hypothetical protein
MENNNVNTFSRFDTVEAISNTGEKIRGFLYHFQHSLNTTSIVVIHGNNDAFLARGSNVLNSRMVLTEKNKGWH